MTRAFKEACLLVFDDIGGTPAFARWAQVHPTEFYKICARLIPTEIHAQHSGEISVPTSVVFELHPGGLTPPPAST